MAFRPNNRNITDLIPMWDPEGIAAEQWFADDWDCNKSVTSWGSEKTSLRVMTHYTSKMVYIICTDRGRFLKHPTRGYESKGRTRYFRTAAEAAKFAEGQS